MAPRLFYAHPLFKFLAGRVSQPCLAPNIAISGGHLASAVFRPRRFPLQGNNMHMASVKSNATLPHKMYSIEAARGIAALIVVLMHSANLMRVEHLSGHIGLNGLFNFGYVGVDFFFVLSGFIITYVHAHELGDPKCLPAYLWRRLTRIYPIFWICLSLQVLVIVLGRLLLHHDDAIPFTATDVLATVFLVNIAPPQFLGVAWSLQFEVMFYLIFCLLFLHRRIGLTIFALWALAIIGRVFLMPDLPILAGFLSAHSLQFIIGVGVAIAVKRSDHTWAGLATLIFALLCFIAATGYDLLWASEKHGDIGRLLLAISTALILLSLTEMEKRQTIKTPKLFYQFGSVSYSIYLAHIIFINVIYSLLLKLGLYHQLPETAVYFIAVTGALAGTLFIGFFIELPLVARLKNLTPITPKH